jgi:methionyl-tRNA formyltransferase
MRVLALGYEENPIIEYLKSVDEVFVTSSRLTLEQIQSYNPDFIVSYGYKYILRSPIVKEYSNRIINLHISKLPWNRGYHPNFWSFYDNTPKGVTIHLIDEGIDTGRILLHKDVDFREAEDTLGKTYKRLRKEIEDLFIANWIALRSNRIEPLKQSKFSGSHHYQRDLETIWPLLSQGWDTPIYEIEDLGEKSS